jgi:hypothetical protein
MIFPNTNLITYSTSYSSILERSYNCTSSLDSLFYKLLMYSRNI